MKRIVFTFICIALCLVCVSCGKKPEPVAEPSPTPAPESVVVQTSAPSPTPLPETPVPTETPEPTPVNLEPYTIAWISDPQYYSKYHNGVFESMTDYLAENADELNLVYIINTGDFVHNTKHEDQWETASKAMERIDILPNGVCAGNHDVGTKVQDRDYSYFSKYFGEWRYRDRPWYGGSYSDNKDHYDLIEAGATKYLFVYLGYQVDPEDLAWACEVFASYPDRIGFLCTHDYFTFNCTLSDYGQQIYDGVVVKCSNLYAVLCGHRYTSNCVPIELDDDGNGTADRTVLQMICNYQAIGKKGAANTGGDGYIRLMTVDEPAGVIRYTSYSPYLDDYVYFDDPAHQHQRFAFDPENEAGEYRIPWLTEQPAEQAD